jgi:hypothetical protein
MIRYEEPTMLRLRTIATLLALAAGLVLISSSHALAEGLFGGPFQRAEPAQKAIDMGSAQKIFMPSPAQKIYDMAPAQKVMMPVEPMPTYGPMQKMAASSCCCPQYGAIRYHNHPLLRKRCCACHPAIQTILAVQDPRHGCCGIEIPVCISACCTGAPQVSSRVGLLGCGYVTYRWCCGFTIKIIFRARGDILVHTYGL